MNCLECEQNGVHRSAVAICHNCSAALCLDHAEVLSKHLEMLAPLFKTVELPLRARVILCHTCRAAITQPHLLKSA